MTKLTTLTVRVLNRAGNPMFQNPRFLRVYETPSQRDLCVARHGKALIVQGIAAPDAVIVDGAAPRIDLAATRPATNADIGLPMPPPKTAPKATPSDLTALVAKYTATIKRVGAVFIENALTHTRDPIKRDAMEIALGRKGMPGTPTSIKEVKAPKKGKAKPAADADGWTPAILADIAKGAETKPAVNVEDLAKALSEAGDLGVAFLNALANSKR